MGDFSLTTFTSEGKLKQIEHALKAVSNGETAIGIRCKNGVIIAVEKRQSSPLIDENSVSKIQLVADHVGTTYAGPSGDYRVLLKAARKNAMEFGLSYGTPILMSNLTRNTAQTVQNYTVGGGVR